MFFKISMSVIAIFSVVIYMNIPEDSISLNYESVKNEIKKEAVQVSLQQKEVSSTKGEYESYVITGVKEKFLPQNVYVGDKKDTEIVFFLQSKANVEGLPSPQYSLHTLDYNAVIPARDIMDTTQQKEVSQERTSPVLISPFVKEAH